MNTMDATVKDINVKKLLTVSVAAYNVERTIREVLDSLLAPEILNYMEVFVVDDGGTDGTLEIAKEYEKKYPGIFYAVHKENGGYGSTVNYSLAHASGKYFKLLDGDDWYDTANLPEFIHILEKTNADMVSTPYIKYGMQSKNMRQYAMFGDMPDGEYMLNELHFICSAAMHSLAYRTDFLRSIGFRLTEHRMYTDTEYACMPLPYVKEVYILGKPIYLYRTEIPEQSISPQGRLKYCEDHEWIVHKMVKVYQDADVTNKTVIDEFKLRLIDLTIVHMRALCWKTPSLESRKEIKNFYRYVQKEAPEIARGAMRRSKLVFSLVVSRFAIYPFCNRYCIWKDMYKRKGGR